MFGLDQPTPQQDPQKKQDPLNVLYFLCNVHATTITVFIRTCFGSEALAFPGLFAFVLLLFCMGAEPRMLLWVVAWIPALITQRIITRKLIKRGASLHSRYAGYPWLAMKVPFVRKELTAMQFVEPMFCLMFGVLLLAFSQFMGTFLALGFITLIIRGGIDHELYNRRLTRMRDAEIEGQWYAEGMRRRGDGF